MIRAVDAGAIGRKRGGQSARLKNQRGTIAIRRRRRGAVCEDGAKRKPVAARVLTTLREGPKAVVDDGELGRLRTCHPVRSARIEDRTSSADGKRPPGPKNSSNLRGPARNHAGVPWRPRARCRS
jgi:hypothetical protein